VTRATLAPGYIGFYLIELQPSHVGERRSGGTLPDGGHGQDSNRVTVVPGAVETLRACCRIRFGLALRKYADKTSQVDSKPFALLGTIHRPLLRKGIMVPQGCAGSGFRRPLHPTPGLFRRRAIRRAARLTTAATIMETTAPARAMTYPPASPTDRPASQGMPQRRGIDNVAIPASIISYIALNAKLVKIGRTLSHAPRTPALRIKISR